MNFDTIAPALKELRDKIPNISEFFTDKELSDIVGGFQDTTLDKVCDEFMDAVWDRPIRRCTMCGNLMVEGYLLGDYYACSDECRNSYYKIYEGATNSEEAHKMYVRDCHELEDKDLEGLTIKEIDEKFADYPIGDTVFWTSWL